MVLVSVVAMQGGQATAKLSFALAGPLVITALRFGLGAMVLFAAWRPRLPADRSARWAVLGLGTSLAGVNFTIYQSLEHLPLGLAVTLQFLGPLLISLFHARRRRHAAWALLAAAGVVLINYPPSATLSGCGIAYGLASAACWAAYILISAHMGARTTGGGALALATAWAALLTVPFAAAAQPHVFLDPRVLAVGLVVALLSTVLANSLELQALRHIPPRVFSILVSLEPAVAALIGLVALNEQLTPAQWLALAAIVTASLGVTAERGRTSTKFSQPAEFSSRTSPAAGRSRCCSAATAAPVPPTPRRSDHTC